jgi:DNA-binding MarR family transcriptional regulator
MARAKRPATSTRTTTPRRSRASLIEEVEGMWRALNAAVSLFQTRSAAQRGLTATDLQAIDLISREETVCASDLAAQCCLTPGAITGMLNRLERAGVARRTRDTSDARRVMVRAERERPGNECLLPSALRKIAASFSDPELEIIRRFLQQSADTLRREAESMRDDPARTPGARTERAHPLCGVSGFLCGLRFHNGWQAYCRNPVPWRRSCRMIGPR